MKRDTSANVVSTDHPNLSTLGGLPQTTTFGEYPNFHVLPISLSHLDLLEI